MGALTGQVAVVTGATRGIGNAIARRLADEGANLALIGTRQETADAAAAAIAQDTKVQAKGYAVDVSDFAKVNEVISRIIADFGRLDILVNNAGITKDNLLMRMREEEWDAVLAVNLKGAFNCLKAASRTMLKAHYGRIVNIASIVGLSGNAGQCNYAASKAGLVGFSKSLARELASRDITVNVIAPGFIDTDMTAALPQATREALCTQIPMGRCGKPEDVANAVCFLASPAAAYITGQVLCVDGGLAM